VRINTEKFEQALKAKCVIHDNLKLIHGRMMYKGHVIKINEVSSIYFILLVEFMVKLHNYYSLKFVPLKDSQNIHI
jgi:hypothetical protein